MRVTSKGQVTIPQDIRNEFGLLPHTEVEFVVEGSAIRIVKAESPERPSRGRILVEGLRGRSDVGMSTDEILALTRDPAIANPAKSR